MTDEPSGIRWAEISSWNSVGWYVALLVGIWGALMGVGDYWPADLFFVLAVALVCIKWGNFTRIHTPQRRIFAFGVGILFGLALVVAIMYWSIHKATEVTADQENLQQLKKIPNLEQQVNTLPALRAELNDLKGQLNTANGKVVDKQGRIEALTDTVVSQQNVIATAARKDLATASSNINLHIDQSSTSLSSQLDQYRNDARSALASGNLPDRSLSEIQTSAIRKAYSAAFCALPQKSQFVPRNSLIMRWDSSAEATAYASDFLVSLEGSSCKFFGFRSPLESMPPHPQIKGVYLVTSDWNSPTPLASAIRDAFISTHIPFVQATDPENGKGDKYSIAIIIGAK